MTHKQLIQKALSSANKQAKQVLEERKEAAKRRNTALKARAKKMSAKALAAPATTLDSAGILIAEGDSWFDYPLHDVLSVLEDEYGYDVESTAHKGDTVEDMAYSGSQLREFTRKIEKILRRGKEPKAILLSGGGNDVSGEGFGMLLNHIESPNAGLNAKVVDGILNDRIAYSFAFILGSVTKVCVDLTGKPIPILTHGYDYPVPDGRGFLGGFSVLPGPWLEPGFRQKGYEDLQKRIAITKVLIDQFNTMLKGITANPAFGHVRHVDLRGTLSYDLSNYKTWWGNELHPTEKGFYKVAEKFHAML